MDKSTSLVCDFAKLLAVPTQTYREQITKVCKLQDIALEYGWIVLELTETFQCYGTHRKTYSWMRHEVKNEIKLQREDI